MVEAEKAEVIRELKAGRDALGGAVAGLGAMQMAARKPAEREAGPFSTAWSTWW